MLWNISWADSSKSTLQNNQSSQKAACWPLWIKYNYQRYCLFLGFFNHESGNTIMHVCVSHLLSNSSLAVSALVSSLSILDSWNSSLFVLCRWLIPGNSVSTTFGVFSSFVHLSFAFWKLSTWSFSTTFSSGFLLKKKKIWHLCVCS